MLIALAQKLKERRTKHYQEMLTVQEEQDRKAAEEIEESNRLIDEQERKWKDNLTKAKEVA